MMWIYTGKPGSGKSLHAAQDILFASWRGRQVIANFAIRPTAKQKKQGKLPIFIDDDELTVLWLLNYAKEHHQKTEDKTLLIIDEAQIKFNCRDYQMKDRKLWTRFFSIHRHIGFDIVLITQDETFIDKQIRIQAEYEVVHRCANNWKIIGLILTLLHIKLFITIEKWYMSRGLKEVNSRSVFFGRKKYYNMYDSYANFKILDDLDAFVADGDKGRVPLAPATTKASASDKKPSVNSKRVKIPAQPDTAAADQLADGLAVALKATQWGTVFDVKKEES